MNEIAKYWNRQPCGSLHPDPTTQRYFVQPHIRGFAQFGRWKGKRVLEIGCGIGTDTLEFARAGADIDAVEFSVKSRALAMKKLEGERFFSPIIWQTDAENFLPFGRFDLVYSFGVLHHTPHPVLVLAGTHNILKNDGELRIMLYAKWSIKHLFRIQPEAQAGCPLVKWYSEREARKLLESCGFRVTSIEKTHIFPWRIKDYIEHRCVKAWPWRWMSDSLFHWLEHRLGHHLLIVAVKG